MYATNQKMDCLNEKNIKEVIGPQNAQAITKPESNTPPILHWMNVVI